MLAITNTLVMYKFSIHNSVHVPYVHAAGGTFKWNLSTAFVDTFSLRGPVGLGNDRIGLQYFKINIMIEELKFTCFYGKIYRIPYI